MQGSFKVGQTAQGSKTVSEQDIDMFAKVTGDSNPLHIDPEFANTTRFKGRIAHGMLIASLISAVLGTELPGPGAIYLRQTLNFLRPVRIGDRITAEVEVSDWDPVKRILRLKTRCINQNDDEVINGDASLLVESSQDQPCSANRMRRS